MRMMHKFMRGGDVGTDRIIVEAPDLSKMPDLGG